MKPRKKQRIEREENGKEAATKSKGGEENKNKKQKPVADDFEESSEDEALEETIDDADDLPDDEIAIDEADDSEESDQDDFQDVKLKKRKKQSKDPASFASAMSAILSSSLKAHTRADPILARLKSHAKSLESAKTEYRLRKALSAQRKALKSIGHVEDLTTHDTQTLEYERSMRKTAQRGVVKLFNAIRASQIKAEEAVRMAGTQGEKRGEREQRVQEMSREGFLNLIKSG